MIVSPARTPNFRKSSASSRRDNIWPEDLSPGPTSGALAQKRRNSFLSIVCQRVHRHNFLGVGVCFRLVEIDLRVISLLSQRDRKTTSFGNVASELSSLRFELISGNHSIYEPPFGRCWRIHHLAG